ncbi:hypothetical protein SUGI_0042600 [Cryptomeria japonica]|nr:hypothetical protein SUGI_0042600 [Cryptomeria japonica]
MHASGNFLHLNSGAKMPVIGLGMATEPIDSHQLKSLVLYAIQIGYRHFDSASLYTSQIGLGDALNEAMKSRLVSREEVFVTSKVWCTDVHADDVLPSLQNSLRMLQLDYVDLYLIHFPVRLKKEVVFLNIKEDDILPFDIKSTWQAMEKCVELGLTKSIGVSNFSCKKIEDLLAHATITPSVNQVEMHPFWQQRKLREYCSKLNIHVSAYAPLGSPAKSWGSRRLLDSHVINGIAQKYSKTNGQIALRWGIEQGVCVIPKSIREERLLENFEIFDFQLCEEDHQKIETLEQQKLFSGKEFISPTNGPYRTLEELWDGEI